MPTFRTLKLPLSYYHRSSYNYQMTVKCIPWQWDAYLMEIIAGLLSCAAVEGDGTRWTVWTRPFWRNCDGTVTERRWNDDGTEMEQWRNGDGTEMERGRNGDGTVTERRWNGVGTVTERSWNGDGTETWLIVWIGPNTVRNIIVDLSETHK